MKNIQVIDRAVNATYSFFQMTDAEFQTIFPEGIDIELIEDFIARVGEDRASKALAVVWGRPIHKSKVNGVHGTLFFGFEDRRHHFPTSKREVDRPCEQLSKAQRELYAIVKSEAEKPHL